MSQRASGFERVANDLYQTPAWVLHALAEHVEFKGKGIWEPACGQGKLAAAIVEAGAAYAHCTDIVNHGCPQFSGELDFTIEASSSLTHYDGIVTNPPYGERAKLAEAFIEGGLRRTRDYGFLALLLPVDFDSGKTRAKFFDDCPRFAGKVTLTKRIKWFDDGSTSTPSVNHAWFLWQQTWIGERQTPRIMYAPRNQQRENGNATR